MWIKKLFFISCALWPGLVTLAQNDPQAKEILDKVSRKNNSYRTIESDFRYTLTSIRDKEHHVEKGRILMKGKKYCLELASSDIIFDGKSIYTYLKASNEINITKPEPAKQAEGDFFFSSPRDLFKIRKDFLPHLIREVNVGPILCYEIDLYPKSLKTNYLRIRMHIRKSTYQIVDTQIFMKDGTQHLIQFLTFKTNLNIPETEFIFDKKKYPKAEVNDMRF